MKDLFSLERHRAKTLGGLLARIAAKVAAYTCGQLLNTLLVITFQRFALGPGSSSTLLRRFERGRTEDLDDVGVTLRSGPEAIQVRWPLSVGLVSRRFACVSVEGLAASRRLQKED